MCPWPSSGVYRAGGYDDIGSPAWSVCGTRFDTTTRSWELLAEPPVDLPGRGGAGFVASADGRSLFVVGGFAGRETNSVHRFDLAPSPWQLRRCAVVLPLHSCVQR